MLHQMGQFHGWFWRVGKTKKIRAKLKVRSIHPEFIQNSLQNSFRNSPKIHPRIYSEIHHDNLKIHLEFTARDSSRENEPAEFKDRPARDKGTIMGGGAATSNASGEHVQRRWLSTELGSSRFATHLKRITARAVLADCSRVGRIWRVA